MARKTEDWNMDDIRGKELNCLSNCTINSDLNLEDEKI